MIDNKKIYQKNQIFRWVSIGGILFLLIFQSYLLYATYQNLAKIINRSIDEAFTKAVSDYRTIEIKKKKDPISISFNEPENNSNKESEIIKKDFKKLNLSIDEVMYKANSMILFDVVFDAYKLDSIYTSVLKDRKIFVEHQVILYKHSTNVIINNTTKPTSNYESTQRKELNSTTQAQVFYKNPAFVIFEKMLWFLILSILLIFIVSYALIYQLRMIAHQKKIETVRQDFVDSMTHELKHPLQGALSLAEILENHSFAEKPELRNNAIQKIKTNLENLGKLLDSIVEKSYSEKFQHFAKLQQGNILNDIDEIIANYTISSEKTIKFITNYHNLNGFYWYDKVHFPNAIKNLVDNAIKYSKELTVIKINAKQEKNKLIISVEDNGIGIRKEELNNIFNKFYRVHDSQKNKGLGLGLSYVKWVCDIHDGEVLVSSIFGKGSKFSIVVPIIEKTKEDEKNSNSRK